MTATSSPGPVDDGSAAVLALWAAVLVVLATALASTWAGVVVARHKAGRIADEAALAAARSVGLGPAAACATAARVTAAAGGRLESCRLLADGSVGVVVAVDGPSSTGPLLSWHAGPARARARAGVPP